MIRRKIKLTIPQYRERKEIFDALGYREVNYLEKGINAIVTQEIDENEPHYVELRKFERGLYRKGPSFLPIILLVFIAFALLSTFVILLAQQGQSFDLTSNALSFLLPAFTVLFLDVLYTYFYFSINKRIIEKSKVSKPSILSYIESIKK